MLATNDTTTASCNVVLIGRRGWALASVVVYREPCLFLFENLVCLGPRHSWSFEHSSTARSKTREAACWIGLFHK